MKDAASLQRAAVLGSGTMGHGIAQVLALSGLSTAVYDVEPRALDAARAKVRANLDAGVERGKVTAAARDAALAALAFTADLDEALRGAEVVIEAVPERLDLKRSLFERLGKLPPDVLLATNTSSLSITKIAAAAAHPERVVGMHFFNPVPKMKLVEVVAGRQTSEETVAFVVATAMQMGKTPVEVSDAPGFVANRLLIPMINEAVFCLTEGVAAAEDIDTIMKLGAGHPMGPLELADLIGLDVVLSIMEVLHHEFGDDKYRPAPMLRQMVAAGQLGRKTGEGFYTYSPE